MTRLSFVGASLISLTVLGACGITPDPGVGPNGELPVIARPNDRGIDAKPGLRSQAAIAYDGDGCQTWLIDDGLEGYATRRNDPVTGLPVCNSLYPPGTVVKEYRANGIPNWIPR
jgi:hypothetical protein